jgi:hypothetical protein
MHNYGYGFSIQFAIHMQKAKNILYLFSETEKIKFSGVALQEKHLQYVASVSITRTFQGIKAKLRPSVTPCSSQTMYIPMSKEF